MNVEEEVGKVQINKRDVACHEPVVVLGMHRSGTSALGGVLVRLGVEPPKSLMVPTKDNPKGYWESVALMQFNNEVLASAGTRWSDWDQFNPSWMDSGSAEKFIDRLAHLLDEEFADSRLFLVKDPRICRLLPLWRRVFEKSEMNPKFILPVRHPFEVARSLEARDGFGRNRSNLVWLRHVLDAEYGSRGCNRVFVGFADLLRNWRASVDRMAEVLAIKWPKWSGRVEADIDCFLTSELRHYASSEEMSGYSNSIAGWIAQAHQAFLKLAADGHDSNDALQQLDSVRNELNRSSSIYASVIRESELKLQVRIRGLDKRATEASAKLDLLASQAAELGGILQSANENFRLELPAPIELATPKEHLLAEAVRADTSNNLIPSFAILSEEMCATYARALNATSAHDAALTTAKAQLQRFTTAQIESVDEYERQIVNLSLQVEKGHLNSLEVASEQAAILRRFYRSVQAAQDLLIAAELRLREKDERIANLEHEMQDAVNAHQESTKQYKDQIAAAYMEAAEARHAAEKSDAAVRKSQVDNDERFREIVKLSELLLKSNQHLQQANAVVDERQKVELSLRAQLLKQQQKTAHTDDWNRVRLAVMSGRLEQANAWIEAIKRSRSWRLTRPLRRIRSGGNHQDIKRTVLAAEIEVLRKSKLFDSHWYLKSYPDVAASGTDPVLHYLECGARELRNPSAEFNTGKYVSEHPDIIQSGENPLLHYLILDEKAFAAV